MDFGKKGILTEIGKEGDGEENGTVKMDCEGCERRVKKSVEGMKGVTQVEVNPKQSKLTESCDQASASASEKFLLKMERRTLKPVGLVEADYLLIASGSSPQGHNLVVQLVHSIIDPVPSLFTFKIEDAQLIELSGIGPMLVTHWGLSGPAILRLSTWGARYLYTSGYKALWLIGIAKVGELWKLFDEMAEKNVVSWTIMINGYLKLGYLIDGFGLFSMMRKEKGVFVGIRILFFFSLGISIITMYGRFGCIGASNLVFDMMTRKDLVSWNSLIMGYVQENEQRATDPCTIDACQVFMRIKESNDVSFNTMIVGFAQNGFGEALILFGKMQSEGQEPNPITFLVVLSACTHLSLIDVVWEVFKSIKSLYNIELGPN
ncbi:hypothetical protein GQ457_11G019160 [Hibiscus cannabinus]